MKIEELVNSHYDMLNENDIHIWEYILSHRKECENLTIDELASRCYVSRTTVMRFAQRIGLKGYAELKSYLRMDNRLDAQEQSGFEMFYNRYARFMKTLKEQDMTNALELISKANRLYVYGTGIVQSSAASEMKRVFLEEKKLFNVIQTRHELSVFEKNIYQGDLVVIISVSGENQRALDFAKKLKAKNVSLLSITSTKSNSLSRLADEAFYVDAPRMLNTVGGPHDGLAGFFLLIDFLMVKYIEYHGRKNEV